MKEQMIWGFCLNHQSYFPQHKWALDNVDSDVVDHDDNRKREPVV